jgi:hypothetical protein
VRILARLPGTGFGRTWRILVPKEAGPQTARVDVRCRQYDADSLALPEKMRIRGLGAGTELYYPYLRHSAVAFGILVTGTAFAGFTVARSIFGLRVAGHAPATTSPDSRRPAVLRRDRVAM